MRGHAKVSSYLSLLVDAWSQYDNPEEGKKLEGDIYIRQTRKTVTRNKLLLWPDALVKYYVDPPIGELLADVEPHVGPVLRNHDIEYPMGCSLAFKPISR